jgi:hypothetical protein
MVELSFDKNEFSKLIISKLIQFCIEFLSLCISKLTFEPKKFQNSHLGETNPYIMNTKAI